MNDDDHPSSSRFRAWLQRMRQTLCYLPQDRKQLVELLRKLEGRNLIDPESLVMVEGALQVSELQVRDIMVPRAEMVFVEADAPLKELLPAVIESGHSRFPILDTKNEQVVGILLAKDLLGYSSASNASGFSIKDIARPPVFVPESKRLNVLLRDFRSSRNHLAIVIDEYGRTAGLVSIEDVIEQIVGDIADEYDIDSEEFIKRHRDNRYMVKARTPIADFNEYFHTTFTDDEFDTIGGLLLKAFGHLPTRGESIEYGGFRFRVIRADQRRLQLLRVTQLAVPAEPALAERPKRAAAN
jgi:magnesium and cobalt transporter